MVALNDGYFETKRKLFIVTYCINASKYIYKYVQMLNTYVCMFVCRYANITVCIIFIQYI